MNPRNRSRYASWCLHCGEDFDRLNSAYCSWEHMVTDFVFHQNVAKAMGDKTEPGLYSLAKWAKITTRVHG